ncbi:MarR family winged helix-turn-helix transcriptional regulator [Chitinimonas sp. JJ19]|uniref:MarR family winged helix-turn-helix transcriptional regulator n=1 Tax=Chitinimonas sp. JJ19 TaxID=3109352 RepID=UPI002FFDC322
MSKQDYSRAAGGAAIGARLRRLSENLDGDSARVYAALGISFEQRWFGVLNQLAINGSATVGELATTLRITHASVSQARQSLEKSMLVVSESDPEDARKKKIMLTAAGKKLVAELQPIWAAFDEAALELNAEAGNVVASLNKLDDALARQSIFDRIMNRIGEQ